MSVVILPFYFVINFLVFVCHFLKKKIADASWAISYVTDAENDKIQAVVDSGCVPHLVKLLDSNESAVIIPALRSVGNIVTGTDTQVFM